MCQHERVIASVVGERCADCGDVLVMKAHTISDCGHWWPFQATPLPDAFTCPMCRGAVEIVRRAGPGLDCLIVSE